MAGMNVQTRDKIIRNIRGWYTLYIIVVNRELKCYNK